MWSPRKELAEPMTSSAVRHPDHAEPTPRRAQTREKLFTAAVTVFAERGIIGSSVEEICERAGFTRGAFYSNFSDKDEFVLQMLQHQAERDFRTVEEVAESAKGTEEEPGSKITEAIAKIFGDQTDNREALMVQQELELYAARRPELRADYGRYVEDQRHRFSGLVEGALQSIGYEFTIDTADALILLHGCWSRLQVAALLADEPIDPRPLELVLKLIISARSDRA
jgi:AcrR family transcriptional regulator